MTICCDDDVEKVTWEIVLSELEELKEHKKSWEIHLSRQEKQESESDDDFRERCEVIEDIIQTDEKWIKRLSEKFEIVTDS